jgi:hypothetical protein
MKVMLAYFHGLVSAHSVSSVAYLFFFVYRVVYLSNYCCFYFRLFELIMNKVRYCLHLLIVVDMSLLSLWQYYPTA